MYLGIEIGGTKLQLGLGAGDGVLRGLWRGIIDPAAGAEGIRRQIIEAIPKLVGDASLRGVGVGFGGPVDDATRTVIKSHQIEGWDGFALADWIAGLLGVPATLGNDADVAGLAEARFGAGQGLDPIFYITIGSGIGGGFIHNSEIYRGIGWGAAEIGHLRLGNGMILEDIASGWAMQRRGGAKGPVLDEALQALAEAICHVIALLCPRRIVIGGGVSLLGETVLFEPLRALVRERVFKPFAACYDIVPAMLGEEVVVQGALALAKSRLA